MCVRVCLCVCARVRVCVRACAPPRVSACVCVIVLVDLKSVYLDADLLSILHCKKIQITFMPSAYSLGHPVLRALIVWANFISLYG